MIDHDTDIEIEELAAAMQKVEATLHVVGDVPAVIEAQQRLLEAGGDLTDLEGFEDKLTAALVHVRDAELLVNSYRAYLDTQHRDGRVRISNNEWLYVDGCLIDAADSCSRWTDYAESELRDIS